MKGKLLASILILANLLICLGAIQPANSDLSGSIHIYPDGSISPPDVPISRVGDTFTFTADINRQLVVECNNVLIDGGGHTLVGDGSGVALNLTCSNVTVQNMEISKWAAGILGVFNNNTIQNCKISQCDSGLKLYADYYVILRNVLENNDEAIRVGAEGSHFIAGNNIDNNKIGFALYYSGSVIVQNNIVSCSQYAVTLGHTAWSQTFYGNNFIDNRRCLVDYTYGDSFDRPVQSVIPTWDNGVSGNYWSGYNGTDRNGDGIGDSPEQIPTYYRQDTLSFYNYVDRYPLMVPKNMADLLPPIPDALIPVVYSQPIPDNQPKALSFLRDVFQVDLNQYNAELTSTRTTIEDATVTQTLDFSLYKDLVTYAYASLGFSNTTLTSCDLYPGSGSALLTTLPVTDSYDTAKIIIQNYRNWTDDGDVTNMINAISVLGSAKNATQVSGNVSLNVDSYQALSTYKWSYFFNGADYSSISLNIAGYGQTLSTLRLYDDRPLYNIGDTRLKVTKQQAIVIAEAYVRNNFTYPLSFANGSMTFETGLRVVDQNTTAALATAARDSSTLYPYWDVRVALDGMYPARVVAVNVRVWADSGTVFSARTVSDTSGLPNLTSLFLFPVLTSWILMLAGGLSLVVAVVIVLIIVLRQAEKQQPPKK